MHPCRQRLVQGLFCFRCEIGNSTGALQGMRPCLVASRKELPPPPGMWDQAAVIWRRGCKRQRGWLTGSGGARYNQRPGPRDIKQLAHGRRIVMARMSPAWCAGNTGSACGNDTHPDSARGQPGPGVAAAPALATMPCCRGGTVLGPAESAGTACTVTNPG